MYAGETIWTYSVPFLVKDPNNSILQSALVQMYKKEHYLIYLLLWVHFGIAGGLDD